VTSSVARSNSAPGPRTLARGLIAAALLVALFTGARGIRDEGALVPQGDMPRYLMDGVFLYDFLGSGVGWTFGSAITYAEHYYAQYPALSIGHHPPLLPISLIPFYAIFGVSIFAARLAILAFFALSVVLLYTLVGRVYDQQTAGWACLLFASNPMIGRYAQRVFSELPTIALVLAALNALVWFCDSGRFGYYVLFLVLAVASLTSRQLAIFMWPAYVAILATRGGWSRVVRRDVLTITLAGIAVVIPIAAALLLASPFNVAVVRNVITAGPPLLSRLGLIDPIVRAQLLPALGLVTAAGLAAALATRDRRIMPGVYWILSVLVCVMLITGPVEPDRYSIMALPAYCLCAGSLICVAQSPAWRRTAAAALTVAVAWQLWSVGGARPARRGGYEEAARFVLAAAAVQPAPTVLYSAALDTGAFVFFVRKHDPARRLVVLRADKLFTTSLMGQLSVEDRISSPQEIYAALDRYGTRFIVIEDVPTGSRVLDWLRDELKGDRFIERRRIADDPSGTSPSRLTLAVYEYRGARPPDPHAEIDLKIPLVGREVRVPLSAFQPFVPQ
jgi:hypothetical protein